MASLVAQRVVFSVLTPIVIAYMQDDGNRNGNAYKSVEKALTILLLADGTRPLLAEKVGSEMGLHRRI